MLVYRKNHPCTRYHSADDPQVTSSTGDFYPGYSKQNVCFKTTLNQIKRVDEVQYGLNGEIKR